MNSEFVYKKLFNALDVGDKVKIVRIGMKSAEGYIARISCMQGFTIFHIEINGRLYAIYNSKELVLIP